MTDYEEGVCDARNDLADGWVPKHYTLDYIVNELRIVMGVNDYYISGYLSVLFGK